MRRAIELVFHEHRITCPYCSAVLIYNLATQNVVLAERNCLKCGKGFVIENNVAKRLPSKKRISPMRSTTLLCCVWVGLLLALPPARVKAFQNSPVDEASQVAEPQA